MAGLEILNGGAKIIYRTTPDSALLFIETTPGTYKAEYFVRDILTKSGATYTLTSPDGSKKTFDADGLLTGFSNVSGQNAVVSYSGGSGEVSSVKATIDTNNWWEYLYTWSSGRITDIIYKVKVEGVESQVLKTSYSYVNVGGTHLLETIKVYEDISGWGSPISSECFHYDSSKRLKFVIPPAVYRQMVNNGIATPESADSAVLQTYAGTEYEYDSQNRVSKLHHNGRKYTYVFAYATSSSASNFNQWLTKTTITCPGDVTKTYYLNMVGQVILKRVVELDPTVGDPYHTKTWYPLYQKFDATTARLVLTANSKAVKTFNESSPGLVTLHANKGLVTERVYNGDGLLQTVQIREGASGTINKLREMTYTAKTAGGATRRVVATRIIFAANGGSSPETTSYAYLWHGSTLQPSKVTTTLPAVPTSEHGPGTASTMEKHYDSDGFLTKSVDALGVDTTYGYSKVFGTVDTMTEDAGTGGLQLTTDYQLDHRGRQIRELKPAITLDINGTATSVRPAGWTYYFDRTSERWSFGGYQKATGSPTEHVVGAVTIRQGNVAIARPTTPSGLTDNRMDWTIQARYTGSTVPSRTASFSATFPRSTWESWQIDLFTIASERHQVWTYFSIPSSDYGTVDTTYGRRLLAYDSSGRQNQTTCAGDTTDRITYNGMGWPVREEIGTGTSGTNFVTTLEMEYDDAGNLTKDTRFVSSTASQARVREYLSDFRNRRYQQKIVVEKDGGGTEALFERYEYDNRDLVTKAQRYHTSVTYSNRTADREMFYDSLGRKYRTDVFGVNSAGGIIDPQRDRIWYDRTGRVLVNQPSGSDLYTATQYNAVGWVTKTSQAYETPTSSSSSSSSSSGSGSSIPQISTSKVMEQTERLQDKAGNVISTTRRQRYDTTTSSGSLNDHDTNPKARVFYQAIYPDAIGRIQAVANYGTNGLATWTRAEKIPNRSDVILVTSFTHNPVGQVLKTTDPANITTTQTFDKSGTLTRVVENDVSPSSSSSSGQSDIRTTHFYYTPDRWLKEMRCENSTTGTQITKWIYGVTTGSGGTGSDLNSKRLVYQKVYPTGSGSTSDHVSYKYNRQQEVTSKKDELGIIHGYSYDKLGRPIVDEVSAIPSGIDSHVNRIETGWNTRGLRSRTTSKSGPSTVRNEVKWDYNDFNQPVTEFQQHGGAVTTGSMKVTYGYEDGTGNTTRRKSMKYPHTGTGAAPVLNLNYVTQQANALSRFDQLKLDTTTVGTFKYLGMGTLVEQQNPKTTLSYGNAANNYDGFDRFGRPVATLWNKTSGGASLVQSTYGRNRVGGIVWRKDVQAHADSVETQDNHYWYDGLQQVKRHDRGELTPTSGPPYSGITPATRQQQEDFTFDQTGNWKGYNSQDPSLAQTRTHNKDNEILTITNPPGVTQPQHDALGNMTTMPDPGDWDNAYTCIWDAWNRLVEVKDGGVSVAKFRYDGLTRRITKETPAQTRSYYFNDQWRALEERISGTVNKDYLWNPADRWNLIRYRYTPSGNGPPTQTRYVLKDGLDPVAVIDDTGTVKERARYEAFGSVTFMNANFVDKTSSSEEWNFLFHGEILDGESGLYNYGYRYYHPELGRWLSRDPIGEEGGLNLYGFVGNDSVNNVDYLGWEIATYTHEGTGLTGKLEVSVSLSCDKGAQISSATASGYEIVLGAGFEFKGNAILTKNESEWLGSCGEGKCWKLIKYDYDWELFWKVKVGIGPLSGSPFGWESIGKGSLGKRGRKLCCEKK